MAAKAHTLSLALTEDAAAVEPAKKPKTEKPHFTGHRQRLRERFLKSMGSDLHDYEIIEMLLFAAHPRGDTKPLAKKLIAKFGSLQGVLGAGSKALMEVEGVSEASATSLCLVHSACERYLGARMMNKTVLSNWEDLLDYCRLSMGHLKEEQFRIFYLNKANALIANELQQKGSVDHAPVYVREVVKRALEIGATAMILCHNHPSGLAKPSRADADITKLIADAGKPLGLVVHDHVIITQHGYFSMKSNGMI
ncbi:DNA repair protein RadC [bacterium]|nr:DNA repair protein RadC [bacterium]